MKKAYILKAGLMLMLSATVFTACKKDKKDNNGGANSSKIVGTWKGDFYAQDVNGNGSLDDAEKVTYPTEFYQAITFNSNGTMRDTASYGGISQSNQGTWSINGDDLTVVQDGDTGIVKIVQLDASKLIVKDLDSPVSWSGFVKQ